VIVAVRLLTATLPTATGVTVPMPFEIEAEVAFAVVHDSVELAPLFTVLGDALSVQVGGFQTVTGTEADLVGSALLVAVTV
jgi:hypothetical protein